MQDLFERFGDGVSALFQSEPEAGQWWLPDFDYLNDSQRLRTASPLFSHEGVLALTDPLGLSRYIENAPRDVFVTYPDNEGDDIGCGDIPLTIFVYIGENPVLYASLVGKQTAFDVVIKWNEGREQFQIDHMEINELGEIWILDSSEGSDHEELCVAAIHVFHDYLKRVEINPDDVDSEIEMSKALKILRDRIDDFERQRGFATGGLGNGPE